MIEKSKSFLKIVEELKVFLVETNDKWTGGVCQGTTRWIDGPRKGTVVYEGHSYCHSWVTYAFSMACYCTEEEKKKSVTKYYSASCNDKYSKEAQNFLVATCHSKKRSAKLCSPEAHEALIMWLAKESVFSKYVVNSDDDKSLADGGLIILCGPDGADPIEALWMCKVLRYATEGGNSVDAWHSLVKGGVNPLLALYVATFVRVKKGASFGYTGRDSHSCVFNEIVDTKSLLFSSTVPESTNTQSLFSGKTSASHMHKVQGFCRPAPKSDGWGGTVQGNSASEEDFVKNVLEWESEIVSTYK